jgi:shikimate dehydrogenase
MKKACVIGWPIKQSRSPLIHNYWLRKYGVDSVYEKLAIEPGNAANFIASLANSEFIGCNVTIPHKETAFKAVAVPDQIAKRLGAVNTVYVRDNQVCGTNTDGEGFLASLKSEFPDFEFRKSKVIVLGAGGGARAIIGALCDEGVPHMGIRNRTPGRVRDLKIQFGGSVHQIEDSELRASLSGCDLLINTTPLGMDSQPPLALDLHALNPKAIVADIVYSPLITPLLRDAQIRGNPVLGGLGMLLHQAVRGFELWFGVRPEVSRELYDLVAADVNKASGP